VLRAQGRKPEALERFGAALTLDPLDVLSLDGLARAQEDAGRTDDALATFGRAIELAPADSGPRTQGRARIGQRFIVSVRAPSSLRPGPAFFAVRFCSHDPAAALEHVHTP